jgi:hypothetical protein
MNALGRRILSGKGRWGRQVTGWIGSMRLSDLVKEIKCLVPQHPGVEYSKIQQEVLWDRYSMAALKRQRRFVGKSSIAKKA